MRYSGRKRKGYPSRYDRIQDSKIRKLQENIVLKQHNIISNAVITSGTALEFSQCLVAQGETDLTREGAMIHMQSISIRWRATGSAVATVATGCIRIIVMIDKDPRGALPAATAYLTTDSVLSSYNTGRVIGQERNRGRFKFIYDETYDMPSDAIASADQLLPSLTGKIFLNLKGTKVMFTTDAADISNIEQNNLLICALALGATEVITINFDAMMRFTAPD